MAESQEGYNNFINKQADAYMNNLKKIFKEAAAHHSKQCDSPFPLNVICSKAFLERFMEDFAEEVSRRQKAVADELERENKKMKQAEKDILTHFFGPPFDPRMN